MEIRLHSTVIMTKDFDKMKHFYQDIMQQEIEFDFGNCIGFKNGISLWELKEEYAISKKLGRTYDNSGNKNLEICYETEDFDAIVDNLKNFELNYLHEVIEEPWGQQTIRFYDPENNLIELGESIPCFVKRFYNSGMTIEEVSKRTSVSIDMVKSICL